MTNEIEWKIANEWRGSMTPYDMPFILIASAYLKYKNKDVIKNLMLQNKESFNGHLEQDLTQEKHIPNVTGFLERVGEVITRLPDGKYRETLKLLNECSSKMLIDAGFDVMRNQGINNSNTVNSSSLNTLIVALAEIEQGDSVLDATVGSAGTLIEAIQYHPSILVGQEINEEVGVFAAINLIVNGAQESEILIGDTLKKPEYLHYGKFDKVIQVPPFGLRIESDLSNDDRFKFGPLSKSVGDWAFVSNALSAIKIDGGRAVIVVPNGALFRSGPDRIIRQSILNFDFIEAVISLPNGIFNNTMIPTAILVLNTNKKDNVRDQVQFIKVSEEMVTVINRRERILPSELIGKIMAVFESKDSIKGFSSLVSLKEIRNGDLTVDSYVVQDSYQFDGLEIKANFNRLENIETIKLTDVATLSRGFNNTRSSEDENGKYQVIRISDITEKGINYDELVSVSSDIKNIDDYSVFKGDLLLSIRGTTNKVGYVDIDDESLLFNANLIRIRTHKDYDSEWLKIYLESPMAKVLLERISRGTTIRQISLQDLRELPIPRLTLEEQVKSKLEYKQGIEEIEKELEMLSLKEYNIKRAFYQSLPIIEAFEITSDKNHRIGE
ncbi:MAG: N-6 DNA methylase [Lachnospirales bacterium]